MRLLLDTHVLIWSLGDPGQLPAATASAIRSGDNEVLVSIVSPWEIAIKKSVGKLRAPGDLEAQLSEKGFDLLPITLRHTGALEVLPFHHRDPFDRTLIAQARTEGLTVVTHDSAFDSYDVETLWS
ncbi:MAG TPA: type II toxin-antitoxin system VapC family toxin [Polyangia bacterium]|nr:type II toxin-antitoxin system VapC family toxin [Polyangia bacterium]